MLPFTASSTVFFPIFVLSMYWQNLTTTGAMVGGWVGLGSAVVMLILDPTDWHEILGNPAAIFPCKYPELLSMSICFTIMVVVSLLDKSPRALKERAGFDDQFVRPQTGLDAEGAAQRRGRVHHE